MNKKKRLRRFNKDEKVTVIGIPLSLFKIYNKTGTIIKDNGGTLLVKLAKNTIKLPRWCVKRKYRKYVKTKIENRQTAQS